MEDEQKKINNAVGDSLNDSQDKIISSMNQEDAKKFREEMQKAWNNYQTIMQFLEMDAPIEVLCLDKKTESLFRNNGFLRVNDIVNLDLTKIEWLDDRSRRNLTSRLNEFFPISF